MTQKLPILILLLAFASIAYGQRNCNTMEYLDKQIQENPQRLEQLQELEKFTQKFIENADVKDGAIVTIPVVVHVVYNTSAENITTSQINSQIQVLNDDFRRLNSDADNTWSQAADTEIEFCLATQDPNGNSHSGITRTSTNVTSFSTNDNVKFNSSGGHDAWPASDYMNFWICDLSGGLLGYAQFPGGPDNTDGIVCDYLYVGTEGTATAPFDLGRTATHEVGHWLNLRHIWGDGNCNFDDFVSDTPESDASNTGCATGHVSCGTTDMVQNYMDYSDDACMNLFTAGQRDRMQALFSQGGARESLLSSPGCGGGGGPGGCQDTEIQLTLNFDNYPEETTWEIRNGSGGLEASGGPYGSQPDGSTLVVDICLADGCYDFTIFDSYGDGMCCGYGNGSYSLDDGPTNLASGGQFGSSETTNFCLGGGGGDTEAPTTPTGLSSSNTTQTSTDLSWNASTDNVGVDGYNVYVDGSLDGSTGGTSYTVSGLTAGTTYTMSVEAYDAAGNVSGQASTNVTTQSSGGGGTDVLHEGYFESGWDGWVDGGSDCYRYSGSRSWEGNYSIRIRDNSGTRSAMSLYNLDVSSYNTIEIEFYFYAWSMENGEDFWVRYHDGTGWNTVAAYARGTHFNNNTFYVATVSISDADYNFPTNADFRFQCDASANADHVYIDAVTITGISGGARLAEAGTFQTVERLGSLNDEFSALEADFLVHPNPASDIINITADEDVRSLKIYSITGSLVMDVKDVSRQMQIDVSGLNAGLYMINLETEEEVLSQKFVKQ